MPYKTLADYFDPGRAMLQAQQIRQAQMQNEEMRQQQQQQQALQAFSAQPQILQPQAPPVQAAPQIAPPVTQQPDDTESRVKKLTGIAQQAMRAGDGETINQINKTLQRDEPIKKYLRDKNIGELSLGFDPKTRTYSQKQKKVFTKEELEGYAKASPGLAVLGGLPAGEYEIDIDPVKKSLKGFKAIDPKKKAFYEPKGLSELQMIDMAENSPDPKIRARFRKTLEAQKKYQAEEYQAKYTGGITDRGIKFGAEQYVFTGKMPPMGRSPLIRGKIMEQAAQMANNLDMSMPQLLGLQASKKGLAVSLSQQLKNRGAMGSFVRNLDEQAGLLERHMPELIRTDSRLANMPIRSFLKSIKGSANEAIFETYLGEISAEIAKLSTGSTGSVAEISISAREKWDKIHDANLPVREMLKLIKSIKHLGAVRLKSVDDEIKSTRRKIGVYPGKEQQQPTGVTKQLTFNPATGGFD